MEKINVAKLLKDCPKGMELNCTTYESVEFDYIEQSTESAYPIHCLMKTNEGYNALVFTYNGCSDRHPNAKCVIFPKDKTTWEGFVPPCQFKDGDILITASGNPFILKKIHNDKICESYCGIRQSGEFIVESHNWTSNYNLRFATEEEKQKLFQAVKENGYKWHEETKTLEKLVKPKFKVGDVVQNEDTYKVKITEINVDDEYYRYESIIVKGIGGISFSEQDDWELVPNKFDISTLVPFESRVLVRSVENQFWRPAIWGVKHLDWDYYCVLGGEMWEQCIPYEGNEHLLGTTDDCDEYFKNWD